MDSVNQYIHTYLGVFGMVCVIIYLMTCILLTLSMGMEGQHRVAAFCSSSLSTSSVNGSSSSVRRLSIYVCKVLSATCFVSCCLCTALFSNSLRGYMYGAMSFAVISANVIVYTGCSAISAIVSNLDLF